MSKLHVEKAFLVGIHRYCFRAGEPSEIIGVKMTRKSVVEDFRLCYLIEFYDGTQDYVPVSEVGTHWKVISFRDIFEGEIPKITE